MQAIPDRLRGRAFTVAEAAACGVSHNMLRGFAAVTSSRLHFATNRSLHASHDGIALHRYRHELTLDVVSGQLTLPAARTFVDVATQLDDRRLLRVGDWLVANHHLTLDELNTFCVESHLDGVRRARRVAPLVRERVGSPRESDVRIRQALIARS